MSFKGIDHVVVRVGDIEAAIANYNMILGIEPDRAHSDALMADQAFYRFDNGTFLELISPTQDASPLTGSLNKLGDGVHTVAFAVEDPKATAESLSASGVRTIGGAFVHPAEANGLLVQLSPAS